MNKLKLDTQGYLLDLNHWNEEVAQTLAAQEGITLTEDHFAILHFMREHYKTFLLIPPNRLLVKTIRVKLGEEKGNSRYLNQLFPGGIAKQGSKLAGLPKPLHCI